MSTIQTRISFPVKKRSSIIRAAKTTTKSKKYIYSSCESDESDILKSPLSEKDCNALQPIVTPKKNSRLSSDNDNTSVTPPKQRRYENSDDRENSNFLSPKTPSTLLAKLDLGSENVEHEKVSRRKLFDSENNDKYNSARKALHSSVPTNMPARQDELDQLKNFISDHLTNATSGTLYISGPPGTGKTAALTKTLSELKVESKYKEVYINCTSIKSAQAVYSKIASAVGIKSSGRTEKAYLNAIEKHLASKHTPIILVLDEIDQLDSRKQCVLYTIFEWPSKPSSHLILIGIANALDLTDRVLPRLQARCELKPKLMHFAPYNKQQIVEIIINRLNEAGVCEVFAPVAVQMLAGKVAAVSGDVRRALDIARRVIELVSTDHRPEKQPLQPSDLNEQIEKEVFKTVGVDKVVTVLNNVYGTCQNLQEDVDESIPLQQKLLLCSLILMLKKGKNKDVTVGRLHEVYRKVCLKKNMSSIDTSEFVGMCSLLETRGMIKIQGKKEPRLNKVCLEWDEDEVSSVLKDKQLMSSVLQDESVLAK